MSKLKLPPLKQLSTTRINLTNDSIYQFLKDIQTQNFDKLVISSSFQKIDSIQNNEIVKTIRTHPMITEKIIQTAFDKNIPMEFIKESHLFQFVLFLPLFYIMYIVVSSLFQSSLAQNSFMNEIQLRDIKYPSYNLSQWAGSIEVKEECTDIIHFIQNQTLFQQTNTKIPKGILMEGPPGTGKTLLAKIIASETNAHFISVTGSSFVELYVGIGASRIRKLFKEAKKYKQCIIFIDEIDTIGKQRSYSVAPSGNGNDEREQTLNQLLAEMDGFEENTNIIVLAATNRIEILDNALLRPGRFDRIIRIPLPDHSSRMDIIQLYLRQKQLGNQTMEIRHIADMTEGFTGAELFNLINEASILSIKDRSEYLTESHIMEALEKILVGVPKRVEDRPYSVQRRIAIHEIGHAFLSHYFSTFQFIKVTIQPTHNGVGGYTLYKEISEEAQYGLYTKEILIDKLAVTLGGRIAEEIVYGSSNVSIGAYQDLKEANRIAWNMIANYGFHIKYPYYQSIVYENVYPSEHMKTMIEKESLDILNQAYLKGKMILETYITQINQLTDILIQQKTLNSTQFESFF
jgi:cell division protease FtsH